MEENISNKLDERWNNIVMDGTKPPVKLPLRKQLHRLVKKRPNHAIATTNTTTNSNIPLVMVFFFEEGDIRIESPRRHVPKTNNEDTIYNLGELYDQISNNQPSNDQASGDQPFNDQPFNDQPFNDQPFNDQALNNKMETMILTNDSPPLTTNQQIISEKSPFKNDKLSNILIPLTNYDLIIGDQSLLKSNRPSTNILSSSDDVVMNDTPMQDDPDNNDFLAQLREENETVMKRFDEKIDQFQKKIKKTTKELKQMNHDLKQLINQKENKQNEYTTLLQEYNSSVKTKQFKRNRQKSIKRMKQAIIGGGNRK